MTIEEKLQHFYDSSIEEAYQEASQMIEDTKKIWTQCCLNIKSPGDRAQRQK